jgi:hypothetical protein
MPQHTYSYRAEPDGALFASYEEAAAHELESAIRALEGFHPDTLRNSLLNGDERLWWAIQYLNAQRYSIVQAQVLELRMEAAA